MSDPVPVNQLYKLLASKSTHSRLRESLREFLNRAPRDMVDIDHAGIEYLDLGNVPHTIYQVPSNPDIKALVKFGSFDDLSFSASVGLISHVFGLLHDKYYLGIPPTGQKWLVADIHADQIARDWGFTKEISELREVRPQKTPEDLLYPDFVANFSVKSRTFNGEIEKVQNNLSLSAIKRNKSQLVWYTDRYSMACGLSKFREQGVVRLHILTDNFTKSVLTGVLKEMLAQ